MKKKIIPVAATLLLAAALAACSSGNVKKTEPFVLVVQAPFTEGDTVRVSIFKDAIENFHKLLPEITVKLNYLIPEQRDGYTIATIDQIKLLESDAPPDIIPIDVQKAREADTKGLLLDLQSVLQEQNSDHEAIPKNILDGATVNGRLLLLPYEAHPMIVYYNKDIFDKAQIPYPEGDWTWEQFRDISRELQSQYGSYLNYGIDTLQLLLASYGQGLTSPDGTTAVGYLDSPEAVAAVQWLNGYYKDEGNLGDLTKVVAPLQQFDGNHLGMLTGWVGLHFSQANTGYAPLPHFAEGKRANPVGLSGFGISVKSKHPNEAWQFIDYLTQSNNEDAIKFTGQLAVPTNQSLFKASGAGSKPDTALAAVELNYAVVPSLETNPYFTEAWNADLQARFAELQTTEDGKIAGKLTDLAQRLDLEFARLKMEFENSSKESGGQP